jgi:hypothetical protein
MRVSSHPGLKMLVSVVAIGVAPMLGCLNLPRRTAFTSTSTDTANQPGPNDRGVDAVVITLDMGAVGDSRTRPADAGTDSVAIDQNVTTDMALNPDANAHDSTVVLPDVSVVPRDQGILDRGRPPDADILSLPDAAVLSGDLVAIWTFEDDHGDWVLDRSGNGNHARRSSGDPEWAANGRHGGGMAFSGNGHFNAGPIDVAGHGLTLAAWIYIDPDAARLDQRIISKADGMSTPDHFWLLSLDRSDGPKAPMPPRLRFRLRTMGDDGEVRVSELMGRDQPVAQDQWVHVAATYDGEIMTLYLDGEPVGVREKSGRIPANDEIPALIGANFGDYAPWHGLLDEVVIFSMALSQNEILMLMAIWE